MKIVTIGILVFICWASFSAYVYVCKIKDLCHQAEIILADSTMNVTDIVMSDSLQVAASAAARAPDNLFIYFEFDKAEFVSDSALSGYYEKSNSYMLKNAASELQIYGYTDSIGSDEYNLALGYRRAQSVKEYFENRGIPAGRIKVNSKGEEEPQESNYTDEGRAKNRRASITIKN